MVHQPYFLPWLGYFNKLAYASDFIILDNVQYRNRFYHNRAQIKDMHGNRAWLTIPIRPAHRCELRHVAPAQEMSFELLFKQIQMSYARATYYSEYRDKIQRAIIRDTTSLVSINISIIEELLKIFGLDIKLWRSSDLPPIADATDRLIESCRMAGCDRMIMGEGGWDYHDVDKIKRSGIQVIKQVYLPYHPVYRQVHGDFVPYLSTIDSLFNVGLDETLTNIKTPWAPDWASI